MFVLPDEGHNNPCRKSFERDLGKTFPKVFPKTASFSKSSPTNPYPGIPGPRRLAAAGPMFSSVIFRHFRSKNIANLAFFLG